MQWYLTARSNFYNIGVVALLAVVCLPTISSETVEEANLIDGFKIDTLSTFNEKLSAEYSSQGADSCLRCHDEYSAFSVLPIFETAHGNRSVKQGPFGAGALQCETCHGPAGNHTKKRLRQGEKRQPMIAFKHTEAVPSEKKDAICLSCHQRGDLNHWQASVHELNQTACVDCHQVHVRKDPMLANATQIEKCGDCHSRAKLALKRASTHPLRSEQMGCTDCHRPHNSNSEHLLIGDTVNETCFACHAEKRGPLLWEHEPVSDNCANCHDPHGSNLPAMLTQRAPFLCQNCHSSQGHPSLLNDANSLARNRGTAFLLGRSCVNCHSKVHGSNHPSGARLLQ